MNRFYLLAMLLFSLLIPLLPFQWIISGPPSTLVVLLDPVIITPAKVEHTLSGHLQWMEIGTVVYFTGTLIFFLRFALQLMQLYRITRRFGIKEYHGRRVVFVDRGYSPFSFFNIVFINEEAIPEGSLQTILEHEKIHIRQRHSLDMILMEIAVVLQWFNPVMWLTGREIKSIHEYLADEGVLQNGISRTQYQQMILDESMGIQVNGLTNNFNVSLLKKRIHMMTKPKSGIWAKSKLLIALPALAAIFIVLPAYTVSSTSGNGSSEKLQVAPAMINSTATPVFIANPPQEKKSTEKEEYKKIDKQPAYPGGDEAMIKFMLENIKYPEAAKKSGLQGTVYVNFLIQTDGAVGEVKVQRGIGGGCDEEAARVIRMMPNWIPGQDKGKNVAVRITMPVKFKLDGDKKEKPK